MCLANEFLRHLIAAIPTFIGISGLTESWLHRYILFTTGTFDVAGITSVDVIRATATGGGTAIIPTILIPVGTVRCIIF